MIALIITLIAYTILILLSSIEIFKLIKKKNIDGTIIALCLIIVVTTIGEYILISKFLL